MQPIARVAGGLLVLAALAGAGASVTTVLSHSVSAQAQNMAQPDRFDNE